MNRRWTALMTALLILLLSGCGRVRTSILTPEPEGIPEETAQAAAAAPEEEPPEEEPPEEEPPEEEPPEEEPPEPPEDEPPAEDPSEPPEEEEMPEETPPAEPVEPIREDEDSDRRLFDEAAGGELTPEAETPVYVPQEEPADTRIPGAGETGDPVNTEADEAPLTATETVPADEADTLGTDEAGETADSMQTYYLTLLDSRLGSLFECERLYVYWETGEEYRTVLKSSREHTLITGAGAYDVSAKLMEENLTVDAGWVCRKNPDVIVKAVSRVSLEQGASVCQTLAERPEWSGITAIKTGRILLVAEELLDSQAGQIAAMVCLARLMYPDQMSDVDAEEALRALTEEAFGAPLSGRWFYGV